ncbi:outer membrane beta-barrel protein [Flavobacterium sp.]|uniref:outer membrane beta-barrel protein n=1 Tax=Flavobacterium sp. TaxID=239 RepID=UPI0024897CE6|nr:outer membrane beta-barrel protein [Flavobacterium sp.]MDI1317005.1 outer membrane beta-barrel protein [Flavobacterium sp.]
MKNHIVAALLLFTSYSITAQTVPETKESKVSFAVNTKIGFARLKEKGNVTLNGNVNGGDLLLSYKLGKIWDITSGVGYLEYYANTTVAGNEISVKNAYLHIPLQFNGDYTILKNEETQNAKIIFSIGIGAYARTLLKQQIETIGGDSDSKNLGWNFGFSSQIGTRFIVSDKLTVGLGLENQSDLTDMKKDGRAQKIETINAIYFKLGFKF